MKFLGMEIKPSITSFRLPPLIGMIIMSLIVRNLPVIGPVMTWLSMSISGFIRKLCVTCLFCMAGLEIDLEVLRKNLVAIVLFTLLPYACEAVATMFTCKLFLGWGLMFGLTVG